MPRSRHRHLYYDQQIPSEEPEAAGRSNISQSRFAARSPTLEDDYFYREERGLKKAKAEAGRQARRHIPPGEERGLWQRIYRVLTKKFNTSWRP